MEVPRGLLSHYCADRQRVGLAQLRTARLDLRDPVPFISLTPGELKNPIGGHDLSLYVYRAVYVWGYVSW